MSVSTISYTTQQSTQYTHTNSGLPTTVVQSPSTIGTVVASTSGNCYQNQFPIAGAGTKTYDLVSGGLTDLVGDNANIGKLFNLTIQPSSGAIQIETTQSGGMNLPFAGLSGGGFLINPGATYQYAESYSGSFVTLSATKGNFVARAVSGACLLTVGYYGV